MTHPILDLRCLGELFDEPVDDLPVAVKNGLVEKAVALVVLGDGQLPPGEVGLHLGEVVLHHGLVEVLDFPLQECKRNS